MVLPTLAENELLLQQYRTPSNVQAHLRAVASITNQIALAYEQAGQPMNRPLAVAAARLHDVVRLPEQWPLLPNSITTPLPHAEINYLLLRDRWPELAKVIREHSLMHILEPEPFSSTEAKLVYYADKRVNHDQLVTLADRLRLGQERWRVEPGQDKSAELLIKLTNLESELFARLQITPDQITL